MIEITGVAHFCEDIRRESAGKTTLIGIYPTTFFAPSFPRALRRLSVWFSIRLDVNQVYEKPITIDLHAEGTEIKEDSESEDAIPKEILESALQKARERKLPYATVLGHITLTEPVNFERPTLLKAVVKYGDTESICGILNILKRTANASVSEQRPGQSPTVSQPT